MDIQKRSGVLPKEFEEKFRETGKFEVPYYIGIDDIVLLASKAGVLITREIAKDWLVATHNRAGLEAVIDAYIQASLKAL